MRAVSTGSRWLFIEWLYPGQAKFTAFKELKRIERMIRLEGLRGWYAKSERDHGVMHRFLSRFRASKYDEDTDAVYFKKEVM